MVVYFPIFRIINPEAGFVKKKKNPEAGKFL
jgi:hypothetical protein